MEFSYRLTGTGWSVARIGDEQAAAEIPASYLSGALGDLLTALVALKGGETEARFSSEVEPGEYRWILSRDGDDVDLRILRFSDIYKPQHDESGRPVFITRQPLAELVRAVADGASRLLSEIGEEGDQQQWVEHPFPSATLLALIDRA